MKVLGAVVFYIFMALATFGRVFNTTDCTNMPFTSAIDNCKIGAGLFSGALWPLYWGGVTAIYLTKTETKK